MSNIIIFGLNDYTELAHYYLTNDSRHTFIAFSVNEQYIHEEPIFKGLPIVKFEKK